MANIISKLPSKYEEMLYKAYNDLIYFGKLFLKGDFRKSESPPFHYEIGRELVSNTNRPLCIAVARGHGKTTLVKAMVIHRLVFAKKAYEWGFADKPKNEFIAWVSANQKKSQNNMEYVRLHLEYNDRIKFFFSPDGKSSLRGSVWNTEDIITTYGDRMITTSNLASIRGDTLATVHSGSVRYSLVVADDVEHEENTKTANARDRIVRTLMDGILPAIDQHDPGNRLIVIGTPVHYDSFIQKMIDQYNQMKDNPDELESHPWKIIVYSAFQPHMPGGVLWPSWMPMEKLEEIKAQYAHSPKGVGGFYQEYALEVQSSENSLWTRDHIRFWKGYYKKVGDDSVLVIDGQYVPINTFLGVDPATDIDTKYSDYSVIMVIGVDPENNVYVLDYVRMRGIPTLGLRNDAGEITGKKGVVDYIFEMYDRYDCRHGVVEDVPMNRSIFQALNAEKRRLNRWDVSIMPEKPGGTDKRNRIYSELNSRFAAAAIHVKENHFDLIDEIVKFGPKMAHDDLLDALYYACKHAYPPKLEVDESTGEVTIAKKKRKPRPWILA